MTAHIQLDGQLDGLKASRRDNGVRSMFESMGLNMRQTEKTLSVILGLVLSGTSGSVAAAGPGMDPVATPTLLVRSAGDLDRAPAGIRTAYVRGIQMELLAHGYDPGAVDGVMGARTRAAIREYQQDAGLAAEGEASKELLDHLKFVQPKINRFGDPVMGVVLDVQRELARRGYYLGPHDGLYGPATRRAVSRFRADARLPADNGIGSRLLQQIRDAPAEIEAGRSS